MGHPPWLTIERMDAFALGVFLLMAATHFDLWRSRRDQPGHFWLGCVALGAVMVNAGGTIHNIRGPSPWVLVSMFSGAALAAACLLELTARVLKMATPGFGRLAQVLVLALPWGIFSEPWSGAFIRASILADIAIMSYTLFLLFRAGKGHSGETRAMRLGLALLLFSLLYDMGAELGWLTDFYGIPIVGFTLFFLLVSRALGLRFAGEYDELSALRRDLEQRVASRTAELEEANRRLAELVRTDAMTGLLNRRGFAELCHQALHEQNRSQRPLCFLMADVDHFKLFNDTYGHDGGDQVLRAVAETLRNSLRAQDVVARWGGEEFIVMLPGTDAAGAGQVAESLRRAVAAINLTMPSGPASITVSFGVAEHPPGARLEDSTAQADQALYLAKQRGRNRVEWANPAGKTPGAGQTAELATQPNPEQEQPCP
jgi:diguanylate cyclase (GGDEF)-like protein